MSNSLQDMYSVDKRSRVTTEKQISFYTTGNIFSGANL